MPDVQVKLMMSIVGCQMFIDCWTDVKFPDPRATQPNDQPQRTNQQILILVITVIKKNRVYSPFVGTKVRPFKVFLHHGHFPE